MSLPFHQLLIANIMSANFIFIGKSFARIVLFFLAMEANNSSYALFFFDPDFSFIESIVTANWFNLIIKSVRSWSSLCSHGTKICGPNSLILILSLSFPSRFSLFILLCFFVPFSFFVHIFWFFFVVVAIPLPCPNVILYVRCFATLVQVCQYDCGRGTRFE